MKKIFIVSNIQTLRVRAQIFRGVFIVVILCALRETMHQ